MSSSNDPRTVTSQAPQGDLLVTRVESIPAGFTMVSADGDHVLAHSETGHHHVVAPTGVQLWRPPGGTVDPLEGFGGQLVGYLEVLAEHADLLHLRNHDTHDTLRLPSGIWELRRQAEEWPDGWRIATD